MVSPLFKGMERDKEKVEKLERKQLHFACPGAALIEFLKAV